MEHIKLMLYTGSSQDALIPLWQAKQLTILFHLVSTRLMFNRPESQKLLNVLKRGGPLHLYLDILEVGLGTIRKCCGTCRDKKVYKDALLIPNWDVF